MRLVVSFAAILVFSSAVLFLTSLGEGNSWADVARSTRPQVQRSNSGLTANTLTRPQYRVSQNHGRSNTHNRGGCSTNYKFNYLALTLMWGPGFCATSPHECKRKPENRFFTIHGMWPSMREGESPTDCCFDNTFDYNQISSMSADLNKYWFSYFSMDSKGFWTHEWLKHGTCARDAIELQGEKSFFETTLAKLQTIKPLEVLKKDNISPGDSIRGTAYYVSDIIDSLRKITGHNRVRVDCDLEHNQNIPVLTGLKICFDKNLNFADCPQSSRCQNKVLFRS